MKRLVLDKFFERIAIEFQLVWLQHFCGSEKAGIYGIVAVDMANKKLLSKVLLTLAAVLMLRQSSDAFVSPGALVAAAVVSTASPAMAEVPTFSVFGFGSGQSDAYSQNDNPINPYSQFSDGTDTVYRARNQDEVDRKKKALTAAFQRFEATPEYIKTKQAQNLRANLLEAGGSLKEDMFYFSGDEGSKAYGKAREFSQKVSTLGVDGGNKQWARAQDDFSAASRALSEWKDLAKF